MRILEDFLAIFFPNTCEACNGPMVKEEQIICTACLHNLPRTNSHIHKHPILTSKFYGKIDVDNIWTFLYFRKNSPVQNLLHGLKYNNKPEIGSYLGRLFATELNRDLKQLPAFDFIVPVPLHKTRLKRRGYNQSEHLALGLAETLGIPVDTQSLKRIQKSETQTKKNREERWKNVSEIFEVENAENIKGKSILIVDDVMTTGSTLEACMQNLVESGAKKLSVATIAVAI